MGYGVWDKGQCPRKGYSTQSMDDVLSIVSSILLGGQFITDLLEDFTPRGSG